MRARSAWPLAMSHWGDSGRNHRAAATMRAAGTAPTANMARHISLLEKARLTRYAIRMPSVIISWFMVSSRPRIFVGEISER